MSSKHKKHTINHAKFIKCDDCGTSKHLSMDDYGNLLCQKCHRVLSADLTF